MTVITTIALTIRQVFRVTRSTVGAASALDMDWARLSSRQGVLHCHTSIVGSRARDQSITVALVSFRNSELVGTIIAFNSEICHIK